MEWGNKINSYIIRSLTKDNNVTINLCHRNFNLPSLQFFSSTENEAITMKILSDFGNTTLDISNTSEYIYKNYIYHS